MLCSTLGTLIIDHYTFSREGVTIHSCVLIQHDFVYPPKMQILIARQDKFVKEEFHISYLVKPLSCMKCKTFDHEDDKCNKSNISIAHPKYECLHMTLFLEMMAKLLLCHRTNYDIVPNNHKSVFWSMLEGRGNEIPPFLMFKIWEYGRSLGNCIEVEV